ncbi:MAG: hypothetical protein FWF03_00335 [Defluviitaleaceae bacterium]|nr:hypothetical protein [Defluviitaleaceae bacterium]
MNRYRSILIIASFLLALFLSGCGGAETPQPNATPEAPPSPTQSADYEAIAAPDDAPTSEPAWPEDEPDIAAETIERPENLFTRTYPDFYENDLLELASWRLGGDEENPNLTVEWDGARPGGESFTLRLGSRSGEKEHIIIPMAEVLAHHGPGYYYLEYYAKSAAPQTLLYEMLGGSTGAGWYWRWGRAADINDRGYTRRGTVFNLNYRGTFTYYGLYIEGFTEDVWLDGLSFYWMGIGDDDFLLINPDFEETNMRRVEPETVVRYKSNNGADVVDAWRVPDGSLEFDVTEALKEAGSGEYYAVAVVCINGEETKPATLSIIYADDEGEKTETVDFEIQTKYPNKGDYYDMNYKDHGGFFDIVIVGTLKSASLVLECHGDDPEFLIGDMRLVRMPF